MVRQESAKLLCAGSIPADASIYKMKFPPKQKNKYVFDNEQDRRIYNKLLYFKNKKLSKDETTLIKFLFSQLEKNWRDPLEKFIDKLLK